MARFFVIEEGNETAITAVKEYLSLLRIPFEMCPLKKQTLAEQTRAGDIRDELELEASPEDGFDEVEETTETVTTEISKTEKSETRQDLEVFIFAPEKVDSTALNSIELLRKESPLPSFVLLSDEVRPTIKDSAIGHGILSIIPLNGNLLIEKFRRISERAEMLSDISRRIKKIEHLLSHPESEVALHAEIDGLAALEKLPNYYIRYLRAYAFEKHKKLSQALIEGKATVKHNRRFLPSWSLVARIYLRQKKREAVKTVFQKGLETDPEHIDFLVGLGNSYFEEANFNEAEKLYKKVIEIDPNHIPARTGIVAIDLAKGNKPDPEDLKFFPKPLDLARMANLRGIQLSRNGKFEAGQNLYQNAITFLPLKDLASKILFNMGLMMERAKDPEAALSYYQYAIEKSKEVSPKLKKRMEIVRTQILRKKTGS